MVAAGYASYATYEPIVINTGLSVTVRGHLITLYRDAANKTASIRVKVIPGHIVDGTEYGDVKRAADLLAGRAKRFLGADWKVIKWSLVSPPLSGGPVWGQYEQGSGY